jgi:hypothetical protein
MKHTIAMLAASAALIASTITFAAQSEQAELPQIEAEQRQEQLVNMPEPASFGDDICWIAPEWRDS